MKLILCIIAFLLTIPYVTYSQDKTSKENFLNEYQGNWYLPADNSWDYGFFENFVIVKGERWTYDRVIQKPKNYQLELQSGDGQKLKLSMPRDGDGTLHLKNRHTKKEQQYKKVKKFLPPYPGEDRRPFHDSHYAHMDTAYVRGYLRNNTSPNPFKISTYDRITEEYDHLGDVDSLGFFEVKVPLLNTRQVYMDWGRSTLLDVLEPNESYFIFHDLKTKETIVYGDNARLHNELMAYADYTKHNNIRPKTDKQWKTDYAHEKSLSPDDFLNLMLVRLDTLRQIDAAFTSDRFPLSDRAQYYITKNTDSNIGFSLMQRRFDLDRVKGERFSPYYMGIVDSVFYKNQARPATLIREHFTFLTDYVGYHSPTGGKVGYSSVVLDELIKDGKIAADPILKMYVDNATRMHLAVDTSQYHTENERIIAMDTSVHTRFIDLFNTHKILISQFLHKKMSLDDKDALNRKYLNPELADAFYTKEVLEYTKKNAMPLQPLFLEEISHHIKTPFLNQFIAQENQKLIELSGRDLRYQENLRRTDHLQGSKDTDELLASILEPHRGKVVYIDFWGTWCAPCVAEMAYVPALKAETEDMDVVYLYFANRTPEDAWKNFIKSKNLEGANVIHYNLDQEQQGAIETRLGVNSFPTYMLINPKGEFVHSDAPRPSQQTKLIAEMKKLLSQ